MAMAQLPVPMALDIHDVNAADKWRKFLNAWTNYALATELDTKPQPVQVAALLTVIGEDSRDVSSASCSKCGRRHDLRQKESCPAFW